MTIRRAVGLALLVLIWVAPPSPAASSKELARARAERVELQKKLDRAAAAYDAAQAKLARTQTAVHQNEQGLQEAIAQARVVQARLAVRANTIYRSGPIGMLQFLLTSQSIGDFGRRIKLVEEAADKDAALLAQATAVQRRTRTLREQLDSRKRQESALLGAMRSETANLTTNFRRAEVLEARLAQQRETKARQDALRRARADQDAAKARIDEERKAQERPVQSAIPAPTPRPGATEAPKATPLPLATRTNPGGEQGAVRLAPSGSLSCPVAGPTSFTDTWGAPRSGGRSHQGVDMFAAQGTPTAAIADGVIVRRENSAAGGLAIRMRGNDSTEYYYAHLSGYTNFTAGQKVSAGDRIGYVGATGNAAGGPPHLHFEVHPRGGAAINPTPTARRACGK